MIGLGFTNPVRTGGVGDMCMCCGGDGRSGWVAWARVWEGVMSVFVVSLDYLCRWQVQVSVYCANRISAHLMCI